MYLDPGVGSLILQYVIAGIVGIGLFLRLFWKKIKGIFHKDSTEQSEIKDDIDYGDIDE